MKLHILGLAYPIMKGITPVVDNIIKQQLLHSKGEKNQFAYYLGMNNGAITITFGGVDMKYKLERRGSIATGNKPAWRVMY